MATLLQDERLLRVKTTLGADALLLRQLQVAEALDQTYLIQGELVTADAGVVVEATELLGTKITCTIQRPDTGELRHFHGIISAFGAGSSVVQDHRLYRFEAVPAFWLLSRTMDCRIFQEKSVQEIIQTITAERGLEAPQFKHMPSSPRSYCTQFNESDLDFIQRLLDETGCAYFFEHSESSDGWTIAGGKAGFPAADANELIVRAEPDMPSAVTNWTSQHLVQPAKHKAWDYDNLKPSQLKMAEAPTVLGTKDTTSNLEVYRWPGGQVVRPDSTSDTAALRMTRDEAANEIRSGNTTRPTLTAGQKVKIKPDMVESPSEWRIVSVNHSAFDETHETGGRGAQYSNSFTCIPESRTWRSPSRRPRPVIPGVQSAIVTGPSGSEIHTDKYGRVKLHFLWDHRDESKDDTSSCWVRCMQPYGGKWGGIWVLPRIGDEVLVAFQDGDPDRPVVIGSIYNDDGLPPWNLESHNTRSGFRSRSTPQGARDTANMVGFDDKKDSEQFYLQAQKNYVELVKNEKKVTVEGNEIREVTGASQNQSDGKRTTKIKGDETLTVEQGNRKTTIQTGNETLEVSQGNRETTISMGNETLNVKMGNMEVKVSMGNITIKADLGAITIEAMQGITLKGGPTSTVEIKPTGITFKSLKIDTQADLMNQTKGAIEQQSGQGMQKVGGAITMIG